MNLLIDILKKTYFKVLSLFNNPLECDLLENVKLVQQMPLRNQGNQSHTIYIDHKLKKDQQNEQT